MKSELIFCVQNNGMFESVTGSEIVNICPSEFVENPMLETNCLPSNFAYIPRHLAETNPAYRQVIPYVNFYLETLEGRKFLVYRRAKGGSEGRLMGNLSIGFGGHVELTDYVNLKESELLHYPEIEDSLDGDPGILCDALLFSIGRELEEELGMSESYIESAMVDSLILLKPDVLQNWIVSNANEVSKVHVGIDVPLEFNKYFDTGFVEGFENNDEIELVGLMTKEEILTYSKSNGVEIEAWTLAVIDHYDGYKPKFDAMAWLEDSKSIDTPSM